ncbi:MAG: HEAT repeat domain-containing protein [Sphingomonas sp.]
MMQSFDDIPRDIAKSLPRDFRHTLDLFQAALDADEHVAGEAIGALHRRASEDVAVRARGMTDSKDPLMRERGVNILSRLNHQRPELTELCFQSILPMLADPHIAVVDAAISALHFCDQDRAVPHITPFETHENDRIRLAVAMALGPADGQDALQVLLG